MFKSECTYLQNFSSSSNNNIMFQKCTDVLIRFPRVPNYVMYLCCNYYNLRTKKLLLVGKLGVFSIILLWHLKMVQVLRVRGPRWIG